MIVSFLLAILLLILVVVGLCFIGVKYMLVLGFRIRDLQKRYQEELICAYHITFMAMKDHDARNVGVPMQERLIQGQQFLFGSKLVYLNDDNDRCRYVPAMMKDIVLKELNDPDITWLEFVNVKPLNRLARAAACR